MKQKHDYGAVWVNGSGIKVTDSDGREIRVTYGATLDCCTCYAYTGAGYIGGWNCMPKSARRIFRDLVPAINAGILYESIYDLPTGGRYRRRKG